MNQSCLDLLKQRRWEYTGLGAMEEWPPEMLMGVRSVLEADLPTCSAWAEPGIQIYNDAYAALCGERHPQSFGAPLWQGCPEIRDRLGPAVGRVRSTGRPTRTEGLLLRLAREGRPQERHFDFHHSPLRDRTGQVVGVLSVAVERTAEVIARRRVPQLGHGPAPQDLPDDAERLLRLQEELDERDTFYRFLFEHMADAAFYSAAEVGPDGRDILIAANHAACEMLGYGLRELQRVDRSRLFLEGDPALVAATEQRRKTGYFAGDLTMRRKDGSRLPVEVTSRLVRLRSGAVRSISVARDISQRLGRERLRAERMRFDSMVRLCGGIAHDFNNFLTVIIGSLDVLVDGLPEGSPQARLAANALLGAEQAAELASQLLAYAKHTEPNSGRIELAVFLRGIHGLLASTAGKGISLLFDLPEGLPPCEADPSQLTSALLNLTANARDAMRSGGSVTISARALHYDAPQDPAAAGALRSGRYIVVAVQDTGGGMDPEQLARAFEPFFTTKGKEGGSGLGLPMVRDFVRRSGGDVRISSEPGVGTRVELILPQSDGADMPAAPAARRHGRGETVLVVECNPAVRQELVRMLQHGGFATLEATDVDSALSVVRSGKPLHALLTNLDLGGGGSGVDLGRQVQALRDSLAVLLVSGSAAEAPGTSRHSSGFPMLRKPFLGRALTDAVLRALQSASQRTSAA